MTHKYDNAVGPNNAYGRALTLLERQLPDERDELVHLDLACGFGRIAEDLTTRFGLHYIGVDVDPAGLDSLGGRGFEAHTLDLGTPDLDEALSKILDGRRVASVSILDGIEHLAEPDLILRRLSGVLAEHRAVGILSVPNVTHLDVATKALLGQWEYTETGLLDRTHRTFFSASGFEQALLGAGLRRVDECNVATSRSDQHFPADHVGLAENTELAAWLRQLRRQVEPHGRTNQFVWAVSAGPQRRTRDSAAVDAPFLTVLMRTQGRRIQEMREAMLCLASQHCDDFELLVIAHKTSVDEQIAIERLIEDQPEHLRSRTRLLLLDHGSRATPLNLGLSEARGRYIGIYDDDDLVLANWVEDFLKAESSSRGRLLRGVTLRQEVTVTTVRELQGVRGVGSPSSDWSLEFSLGEHLAWNQSPTLSWVFPRSLYTDLGMTFDESMTTTEDWEFLLRAAPLTGVTDIPHVVAIYHWWGDRTSSRTLHSHDEWMANQREVERRVDARPLLLPTGESRRLRADQIRLKELERETRAQKRALAKAARRTAFLESKVTRLRQKKETAGKALRVERRRRVRLARRVSRLEQERSRSLSARLRSRLLRRR